MLHGRLAALPSGTAALAERTQGASAGEFLHATLSDQVAGLQAADVMLRTEQPDAVHQVRVGARRLRSTLAAFHPLMDETTVRSLRDELSWLGAQLADARDAEVALEHLREMVQAEPVELVLGPVAARLQQAEFTEVRAGLDRALLTLSEPRYLRLLDDLHAFLADPPFTPGAEEPLRPVLRDTTQRSVKRLRRRMKAARQAEGEARTEALHEVRKAAKRARYAAEVGAGELAHVKALARSAEAGADGAGGAPGHRGHPRAVPPSRDRRGGSGGERLHVRPAARSRTGSRGPRRGRLLGARAQGPACAASRRVSLVALLGFVTVVLLALLLLNGYLWWRLVRSTTRPGRTRRGLTALLVVLGLLPALAIGLRGTLPRDAATPLDWVAY